MQPRWQALLLVLCAAGGASLLICCELYALRGVYFLWPHFIPARPPAQLIAEKRPVTPTIAEAELAGYIGAKAEEVVKRMELGGGDWFWTCEPPLSIRGVTYFPAQGRLGGAQVTLYIDSREPLHRREMFEGSYEEFLRCRVGGIQFKSPEEWLDVGPDVPWQWRRNLEE
jgi:hypothetical protein